MKKISTMAILAAFVLLLPGCGVTEEDVIASSEDFTVDEATVEAVQDALAESSDSSSDASTSGVTVITSTATSMEKDDPTFIYKENSVSVLDSKEQILTALGTPDPQNDPKLADHYYSFDSNEIGMNIGIGDSKDDVLKAYGEKYETFKNEYGIGYTYDFEKFALYFTFDNDKVIEYHYTNKEVEKEALKAK